MSPVLRLLKGWFSMKFRTGLAALLVITAAGAGCGGNGSSGGGDGTTPSTLAIAKGVASGDGQHATVGQGLAQPLQVVVTEDGTARTDEAVTWSTTAAGVTITPSGHTDGSGLATAAINLGTVAGPVTIKATLDGASGSPVSFVVTADPGAAAKLAFAAQPHAVQVRTVIAPAVRVAVQDANGNTVTGSTAAVTLALANNPSAATLDGGGPVNAVSGVATFPAVSVSQIGAGYSLTATSAGLTAITSNGFNVSDAPPVPGAVTVTVGPGIEFRSNRNNSSNPAVDTVAVGSTVVWNLAGGTHNVLSTGSPSFISSFGNGGIGTVMAASYLFEFNTAGTYTYECGIHGSAMTGRVVVR
jgi:plastocyanin